MRAQTDLVCVLLGHARAAEAIGVSIRIHIQGVAIGVSEGAIKGALDARGCRARCGRGSNGAESFGVVQLSSAQDITTQGENGLVHYW